MIPRRIDRMLSDAPGSLGAYYHAYKAYRWGDPYLHLVYTLADRSRLAVDVGAHLGDYTFFMRRYSAGCVAFECDPVLVSHLRRRFGQTVEIKPDAVSDRNGTAGYGSRNPKWALGGRRSRHAMRWASFPVSIR